MSHVAQSDPQRAGTAKRGVWKAQCLYIYKLYTHVFAIVPQKQYFQREREYCRLVLEVCQEKYIDLEACLQSGTLSWMWQSCW